MAGRRVHIQGSGSFGSFFMIEDIRTVAVESESGPFSTLVDRVILGLFRHRCEFVVHL